MGMTIERAIAFLKRNQPMLDDEFLKQEELDELDRVRRFLIENPDEQALELLLGVFGEGDGFGVYQLVEDAVAAHEPSVVIPALKKRLKAGPRSVRYWCSMISAYYPDKCLVPVLLPMLVPGDFDLRYAAVSALAAIGSDEAMTALHNWLPNETEGEIKEVIEEACQLS